MNITKLTIYQKEHGQDLVVLQTDIPPASDDEEALTLEFKCPRNYAKLFCSENFPRIPQEFRTY